MAPIIMKTYGIIYFLRCKTDGKMYIGQTIQDFKERLAQHKSRSKIHNKTNEHLCNAINKHGWDDFENGILDICYTNQDELNILECFYIEKFNTLDRECG